MSIGDELEQTRLRAEEAEAEVERLREIQRQLVEALVALRDVTRVLVANGTVSQGMIQETMRRNLWADAALAATKEKPA